MSKKSTKYLGNSNLKAAGVNVNFSPEQIEEYIKCAQDPLYFIKNYVKIVSLDKGLVPFQPYDYQEEMIQTIHENRFVIGKLPRQTGKSTTIISYLLHYVLFNQSMSVAILANKLNTARELLGRLQLAYEYLPMWLQQGVVEWNKGSIVLENGSKILASATSSSAVRGGSFNYIFLDEFAYVPQNVAEEFFSSVYPTITSGQSTKVTIISTPKGLNMFYRFWVNANKKAGEEGKNEYVPMEVHWSDVPGRDDKWKAQTIANTSEEQFRTEFECEFLGSMHTLVHPEKLKCMVYRTPEYWNNEGLRVYQKPLPDHKYITVVDTARGQGLDYHAYSVIDVSAIPYRVVATFRNNEMPPMLYPNAIYPILRQYNNAYCLIEVNDIGGQVADILHDELEYDNVIYVSMQGRKGQVVNGGFGGKGSSMKGVKTSTAVKRIGCSILKNLIEDTKLIVEDFNTVDEFCSFVAKGDSFEAEDNHHDDLVMTLVLFGWLTTQAYFKQITGSDIRKDLYEDQMKALEEEMTPFGFVDDGSSSTNFTDGTGTSWRIASGENLDMGWNF